MKKIQFLLITLFLLTSSIFAGTFSLSIDKRLAGEADSSGGIFYDNGNIFVAEHHDGLWKSNADGTLYGDSTGSDKQLYDVWKYNSNLFAVGAEGFFIYDVNGNYISSLTGLKGNALYVQNGFAYVTNDSGGISIIDISDVNNPSIVSTTLTGQKFLSVRGNALYGDGKSSGSGDSLYITDDSGNLYLFDDDKNGTLTATNNISLFTEARRIFVNSDGTVYVNSGQGELAIVSADLTTKTTWTSATGHGSSTGPVAGGVSVTTIDGKRYAFITTSDGYIYGLDVTDSTNISLVSTFTDSYKFNDIWVENSKIYATSHDGFLILDIIIPVPVLSGTILDSSTSTPLPNASLYLYHDSNANAQADSADTLVDVQLSDASGKYSFKVNDGNFFVIVDSQSLSSDANVWMEQTHGPQGAFCADGNGSTVMRNTYGVCYGGKTGAYADDLSILDNAEHVALIDVNGSDITNIDFGFSPDIVSNVNDEGQGSLRQFILNANAIAGANTMKFVPAVVKNSAAWWSIFPQSILPDITDSGTSIDGTAYYFDGSVRDTNVGTMSGSVKLGVGADGVENSGDEATLTAYEKKELEIELERKTTYGLNIHQNGISNVSIKNIAIYGSLDNTDITDASSDILVSDGADNVEIAHNFVGVRADGSDPTKPGEAHGITLIHDSNAITNFKVHHNYVGYVGCGGILATGAGLNGGEIYQNEVFGSYWHGKWYADGVATENGAQNITLYENYVHDNNGAGIDSWQAKGNIIWRDNTISHNGFNPGGNPGGVIEKFGIRSMGDDNTVKNNLIYDNAGTGVLVTMFEESNTPARRTKITQNSIYQNRLLGIDLDQVDSNGTNALGDGITPNNGTKDLSLQNADMDYPVFSKAVLEGTALHLTGYVGSTANQSTFGAATIEVYKVDDDGDSNGEGRWYLGTINSDTNGNFDINITTSLLANGDYITATAKDSSNNTSEFSPNHRVELPNTFSCEQEAYIFTSTAAYIFTSTAANQPTDAYTISIADNNYSKSATAFNSGGGNINAIGYNITDNYIWGYDRYKNTVVKVDNTYAVEEVAVTGLPSYDFHIGDVSSDGVLYMTERDAATIYRVDVNPNNITYGEKLADLNVTIPIKAADFAFSPKDHMLYYVDDDEYLMQIDPMDGTVTKFGKMELPASGQVHSAFFDKDGFMYVYHSSNEYIYKVTIPSVPVASTATIPAKIFAHIVLGQSGDGARCANAAMGVKTFEITPTFDVIDGGLGYAPDANITTKKVGEAFDLTILSQDLNNSAALKDVNITQLDLYDCSGNVIISPWWSGNQVTNADGYTQISSLSVPTAQRCLKVKVYGTYESSAGNSEGIDDFAVRPVHFSIMPWGATTHAGSNFSLQVKAENSTGLASVNYNEVINSSFKIEAKENNVSCFGGDLNVTGAAFSDGNLSHISTYSNTGDINIRVYEVNGSEFAHVDSDDTPDAQRFIAADDINHTFIPYGFSLDWNVSNANAADGFTYFANNPSDTAAKITFHAVAENKWGAITSNYKNGCSAHDVNISIGYDTKGVAGSGYILNLLDDTGYHDIDILDANVPGAMTYTIHKNEFATGELNKTIKFNFSRTQNLPLEPLKMGIKNVTVQDELFPVVTGSLSKSDENATFYFARLHAPDYSVLGEDMTARIFYEVYCKKCDQSAFLLAAGHESVDAVNWYVINHTDVGAFNNVKSLHDNIVVSTNNSDTIILKAPKLSHKNRITYDPVSWLRYNEFNPAIEPHAFNVAFSSGKANWAGKGQLGRTVDMNVSHKMRFQKIDW